MPSCREHHATPAARYANKQIVKICECMRMLNGEAAVKRPGLLVPLSKLAKDTLQTLGCSR